MRFLGRVRTFTKLAEARKRHYQRKLFDRSIEAERSVGIGGGRGEHEGSGRGGRRVGESGSGRERENLVVGVFFLFLA